MSEAMTIRYENALGDMIAFALWHSEHSAAATRTLRRLRVSFPLGLLVILSFVSMIAQSYTYIMIGIPGAVILFLILPGLMRKGIAKAQSRALSEGDNQSMLGMRELHITDRGLLEMSGAGESLMRFDALGQIAENDAHVFIYTSALTAHVIPKQAVPKVALAAFLSALKERSGTRT